MTSPHTHHDRTNRVIENHKKRKTMLCRFLYILLILLEKFKKHNQMQKKEQNQTLTRANIRDAFNQKLGLSQPISSTLLESILQELSNLIVNAPALKIVGFGTFLVHSKKERMGRNPKTKEKAIISSRKSVSFRSSTFLKEQVNALKKS